MLDSCRRCCRMLFCRVTSDSKRLLCAHRLAGMGGAVLAVALLGLVLTTCETSPRTADQLGALNLAVPEGELRLALNPDPDDAHLAVVKSERATAWLYGSKGPSGEPLHVETVVVEDRDSHRTVTAQVDSDDRLVAIADSSGQRAEFEYTADAVRVRFQSPVDVAHTALVPLTALPSLPASPGGLAPASLTSDDRAIRVVTHVRLTLHGQPIGDLKDVQVTGRVVGSPRLQLGRYSEAQHGFTFPLSVHEHGLELPLDRCLRDFTLARRAITRSGAALSALVDTAARDEPLGMALTSWNRTFLNLGIGPIATLKAGHCTDVRLPGLARGALQVTVTHPRLGVRVATVSLDAAHADDMARLELGVDFEAPPYVLDVATDPPMPLPGQSYRLRFAFTPPGATVEWSLTASDGYHQEGKATAAATETLALSEPVPGGNPGVRQTIEAVLVVRGERLAARPWRWQVGGTTR